jgi:hypothetical protein
VETSDEGAAADPAQADPARAEHAAVAGRVREDVRHHGERVRGIAEQVAATEDDVAATFHGMAGEAFRAGRPGRAGPTPPRPAPGPGTTPGVSTPPASVRMERMHSGEGEVGRGQAPGT